jgi:hypothetical protein
VSRLEKPVQRKPPCCKQLLCKNKMQECLALRNSSLSWKYLTLDGNYEQLKVINMRPCYQKKVKTRHKILYVFGAMMNKTNYLVLSYRYVKRASHNYTVSSSLARDDQCSYSNVFSVIVCNSLSMDHCE